jgi:superoxide reductase
MTQVYECEICGNIVEVLRDGVGELVCCDQPMTLLEAHTSDEGYEKHVPVIEKTADGVKVKVGSNPHPMLEEHHIEWIEALYGDGESQRKFLKPNDAPEADFCVPEGKVVAREHCNIHGLWIGEE